jgi:hypothetical protein
MHRQMHYKPNALLTNLDVHWLKCIVNRLRRHVGRNALPIVWLNHTNPTNNVCDFFVTYWPMQIMQWCAWPLCCLLNHENYTKVSNDAKKILGWKHDKVYNLKYLLNYLWIEQKVGPKPITKLLYIQSF